jgi:hypothetical protein
VVWTLAATGQKVAAPVAQISKLPVPDSHTVVEVSLVDGRSVRLSEGHAFADGWLPENLTLGSKLDGSEVLSLRTIAYASGHTFDLRPVSESRSYLANGIWVRSILPAL